MRYNKKLFWVALFFVIALGLNAQNKVSFDLKGSYSIPTEDLGLVELDNGFGIEANLGYEFFSNSFIFGGFEYNLFEDSRVPASVIDYREMGFILGAEYNYPITEDAIYLVLKGGGVYNQVLIENSEGENIHDTDYGLGWFAETGINFNVSNDLHLIPFLKFKSLTREFLTYEGLENADLRYVSVGLGVRKIF